MKNLSNSSCRQMFDIETAIMELEQISVIIEMYGTCLIQEPWHTVDTERIGKMENAFYLMQDQFELKLENLRNAFYRGVGCGQR